jgi:hypothetical protein
MAKYTMKGIAINTPATASFDFMSEGPIMLAYLLYVLVLGTPIQASRNINRMPPLVSYFDDFLQKLEENGLIFRTTNKHGLPVIDL